MLCHWGGGGGPYTPKSVRYLIILVLIYFPTDDCSKVLCLVENCGAEISRGSTGSNVSKLGNGGMLKHLQKIHPGIYGAIEMARQLETKTNLDERDETVRGSKVLFSLRTKQTRQEFLKQVTNTDNSEPSKVLG